MVGSIALKDILLKTIASFLKRERDIIVCLTEVDIEINELYSKRCFMNEPNHPMLRIGLLLGPFTAL